MQIRQKLKFLNGDLTKAQIKKLITCAKNEIKAWEKFKKLLENQLK